MRSVECNTRNDAKSQSVCLLELGSTRRSFRCYQRKYKSGSRNSCTLESSWWLLLPDNNCTVTSKFLFFISSSIRFCLRFSPKTQFPILAIIDVYYWRKFAFWLVCRNCHRSMWFWVIYYLLISLKKTLIKYFIADDILDVSLTSSHTLTYEVSAGPKTYFKFIKHMRNIRSKAYCIIECNKNPSAVTENLLFVFTS